jgi:hypothetical protein
VNRAQVSRLSAVPILLALAACPAWGQFELFLVNGTIVQPVVRSYDCGSVAPGTPLSVPFQIVNISSAPATLDLLTVTGSGFTVASASAPSLPAVLAPQQSVDFTVLFQASGTGNYGAALNAVGIAVTLTATVPVELTYQWVTGSTVQSLAAGPVDFGSVPVGQSPTIQILLLNETSVPLTAPTVAVTGAGFSLISPLPAGTVIPPAASKQFEIQFSPTAPGVATGTLTLGGQAYILTGTGTLPPFPQPQIVLSLPDQASDQQGNVAVSLNAPSQIGGTGTLSLTFQPEASIPSATDPGIAFASGGPNTGFTVLIGTTQGSFDNTPNMQFQTGTTAGTITITAQLGTGTVQQSITILPAIVGVTAVAGIRSAGAVEVDVTGFDNTRTAGALSFTFYDGGGNPIGSPIPANAGATFAAYFQNSAGGTFELKAVFPVQGDTSQIAAFQASVTNSAGTATTARTNF